MKNLSYLLSAMLRVAVVAAVSCMLAVSCYDDTALWDELGKYDSELGEMGENLDKLGDDLDHVTNMLYDLEDRLNSELDALQALVRGQLFISKVSRDASTGIVTVTLSDGNTLVLLPEADLESTVTYMTIGGIDYWAYIDADGNKQLFKNEKGEGIPVASEVPEVIMQDGDYFIVIGGMSYPLGGNAVFSDYEVVADELTGEIYAVTFTFGDDMSFTVTVDGASGFHFVKQAGWSTVVVSDWYVSYGVTERVQVDARGVVDYVLQVPDGWKVREYEDIFMGTLYFDITAPSENQLESGAAVAEGDLKVVAVLEGGKATITRLYLTTSPFKAFAVSYEKAHVEMFEGLQKYVYGVCLKSEYDEASILETASGLLEAFDYPAGYGVASADLDVTVSEILGAEPAVGEEYVFWALPALYYQTDEVSGYYLKEETFVSTAFRYASVELSVSDEMFRDARLSMELKGVDSYYMQLVPAADYIMENVLYDLNSSYYEVRTSPMTYDGSVFELAGVTAEAATDYVLWLAVAGDGRQYTAQDLIVCEFSTLSLLPGGSASVSAGEPVASALEITTELAAAGAEVIYYKYLTASDAKKYTTDEEKVVYLFENGESVEAESAVARISESGIKVKPSTSYVLLAVASDNEGKYGNVLTMECSTTVITYNELEVELNLLLNNPEDVRFSVKCEEAVDFIYWVGAVSDNTWKSSNYLGGSVESAQAWMYQNSTHTRLTSVMNKYPVVDGVITLNDLAYSTDHIIVVMAKAEDGTFSEAAFIRFSPNPVAVGVVVLSSDPRWEAAKPAVRFIEESFEPQSGMMNGVYAMDVTIPSGYTAYVSMTTDAFYNNGQSDVQVSVEDKIVITMVTADVSRDVGVLVDENAWVNQGYPNGYEFYVYPHGAPAQGTKPGFAVIWSSMEYHDSVCGCLEHASPTMVINNQEVPVEYVVLVNDGNPVRFVQPYAIGSTLEVIDRVFIVLQDTEGNCYETYEYDVPVEFFQNAQQKS